MSLVVTILTENLPMLLIPAGAAVIGWGIGRLIRGQRSQLPLTAMRNTNSADADKRGIERERKPELSRRVVLFADSDWYLYNYRLSFANRLRDEGFDVVLLSPPGEYGPRLQYLGFRWHPVPMTRRRMNLLRELTLLGWLVRFLARERPALVHAFSIKCAIHGSLASRILGVPARVNAVDGIDWVYASRDLKARFLISPLGSFAMRLALGGAGSALILRGSLDWTLFRSFAYKSILTFIRNSGVSRTRFRMRVEAPIDEHKPLRVLLAARLLWDKGIAEYIEAARALKKENRTIEFLLAGMPEDGNPASIDVKIVRGWVEEGLVSWLGRVHDMPKLLSEIDVMVRPSHWEWGGVPMSLIEAAACGLPLVTTFAGGDGVVTMHGVDGLEVPRRDSVALASAIRLLDDDRPLGRKLGLAARERVLKIFDERIVIDETLSVYFKLMPCRSSAYDRAPTEALNAGRQP